MAGGPATVADVGWDSFLLSSVQIAPLAWQSVVSGRVMLTAPLPVGSTSTVQPWLLPCSLRTALAMAPPLTVNASSRILAYPASTFSLKVRSKVKLLPSWSAGTFAKLAVSGLVRWGATAVVAVMLVRDSALSASSLKVTRTLMVLSWSAETSW